jgi:hypothetical protein
MSNIVRAGVNGHEVRVALVDVELFLAPTSASDQAISAWAATVMAADV